MRKTNARYPNTPGSRSGAPETSAEAAADIAPFAASIRARVLAAVTEAGERGLTGDQVAAACGLSVYQCRSRLAELRADKIIDDSKRRDRLDSGLRGAVWVLKRFAPPPQDDQEAIAA